MEVDSPLENDLTMILWSRLQNVGKEMKAKGLIEVVAVATIVAVVVEAVVDLLQSHAELTSLPSLEL
jgi:predicted ABC-type exoprotein transport system permease subunit